MNMFLFYVAVAVVAHYTIKGIDAMLAWLCKR